MLREISSITGSHSLEPLAPTTPEWIVIGDALREEKALDSVAMLDSLLHQHHAFACYAATVLVVGRGHTQHRANTRLASLKGQQGSDEGLSIQPVCLDPATTPRNCDRGGVNNMALVPLGLQNPMDPKAVESSFLNDDDGIGLVGSVQCLLLQSGETFQKPRNVTTHHCVT
ncbi:hypothetical protein BJS_08471 [Bradyrhizobium japonicum SEMIA 5079]|nr:hypothetical protein BJS_08471 [Bradyrhizobium japonicum SEMIA 5079]